jgi:hypothetical protein
LEGYAGKMIFKDKKAEIPIVILVLGVILLCILLFASFKLFPFVKNNGELGEVVMMEQCLSLVEQYYFYENMRYSPEEIKELPLFKDLITSNDKIRCKYNSMEIYYPLK